MRTWRGGDEGARCKRCKTETGPAIRRFPKSPLTVYDTLFKAVKTTTILRKTFHDSKYTASSFPAINPTRNQLTRDSTNPTAIAK
jgi:hypothetical protein